MTPERLLALAASSLIAAIALARHSRRAWVALNIVGAFALFTAASRGLAGGSEWQWRSVFPIGGETIHLRLDALGALFLALVAVVGAAGAIYAHEYWPDARHPHSAARGRRWWSGLLLSLAAVLLAANGLHFLIAWELFTVCAYFLITLERRRRDVRAAGWLFLAASHAGTMCLFALFASLAARTGTWDLGPVREQTELAPLFWLVLAGFSVKAGLFPLHVWLPSAHANAPSHVSAILSGVSLKMGVYGVVRFSGWLPLPPAAGWVVMGLGAGSALLGIAFALAQNDLKRLLAYSSVENIGVVMIGVGAALFAVTTGDAAWGRLALAGALLHVWNHGLFKALLFFAAGSVVHGTGTREMSRLGGLARTMPWTAALFALGAVAVSALPPLNGFVSEWLVYLGLFDAAIGRGPAAWMAMLAALTLAMTGALALATFVKATAIVFLGAARTQAATRAHESGPWMRAPMVALAAGCLVIGLAPAWFWPVLDRAIAAWHPAWTTLPTSAPLATLGRVPIGFVLVLLLGAWGLWQYATRRGLRRAPTWGCGYAAPTARMQYTSGAFAGIAARWFRVVVRVERVLRRPRGVLPGLAFHREHTPDAVLANIVSPLARGALEFSNLARRLQHGRVQFYIVYVMVGLAALGTVVAVEGWR